MAERTGMGQGYPGRRPIHRGVHGNGIPHMERQSGSDRNPDSAESYGGTGHQFGNQPGNRNGETVLPSWYHRAIVISAVIGFAVLILIAKMHGG